MAYEPKKLTPAELAELHALPDESLLTAQEAAAFLRLKYGTLAWYRCQGGGPAFVRVSAWSTRTGAPTAGKRRVNEDDIEGILAITPEYALWLVSGKIAPESGQISPAYAEADLKLAVQNAGSK